MGLLALNRAVGYILIWYFCLCQPLSGERQSISTSDLDLRENWGVESDEHMLISPTEPSSSRSTETTATARARSSSDLAPP